MAFLSLRAPMAANMLSLCIFFVIFFLFPFPAFSVSYPPPSYYSGEGFSSPPSPPPHASRQQGFSSPPPPPPHASRRQGFSSPPPPPPSSPPPPPPSSPPPPSRPPSSPPPPPPPPSSPPPPPPHASVRVFRSPPPPPPDPSGEGFRSPPPPPPYPSDQDNCQPYGSLLCGGQYVPTYMCSPKITSSTPAILVTSDFSGAGRGGGGPSECDGKYHNNSEIIVGLSTGWYNGGLLCGEMIKIMALSNGKSVVAKVVDECDSTRGCDEEHSGQPPCGNNIINGSDAVWAALGLDTNLVEVNVSWSTVMDVGCDSNINYIVHIM